MTCFTCERNLSAYIDDELTADTRLEVEAHLEACERCRRDYETHVAAWEVSGLLRAGATPDGLWEKIEPELRKQRPATTMEDLTLIVRGLAGEVRELRQAVEDLRQGLESARPSEERTAPRTRGIRLWSVEQIAREPVRRPEVSEG
ncbi:MAG: hypothetical protein A3F84_09215 [Candidatus Handelsmanbacteria bacterium RIFCSPLOWO2_12_FULL_64_10]|uniref:Putative zinc-finger domain-containing protein n=1 Tax=Handelsmanbacteria sp. (strain RIFCSPLOWO2_12_FULL_64_10) TaxID=1817868 RepID=A0A1F6CZ71_HANXR|nr:MAG: hypothetical protein A3F84_09215 [Candidatus Handelsmanbacteria bacterium RIFCSPLOWO2_12_FULL_64_10]